METIRINTMINLFKIFSGAKPSSYPSPKNPEKTPGIISFDDFKKAELRVATIESAERVEKSEKLIKLLVSLGNEKRQIVAGIGNAYEPAQLVGKQIVIVANLAPRTLMGLESKGMLLAAHGSDNKPILLSIEKNVPEGSTIG